MGKKEILSAFWIFVTLNYIFCDVFTLMCSEELKKILSGSVGTMIINQKFLLVFAIIMEIPMAMILFSRFLKFRINRPLNIIAGLVLTIIQAGSLFVGTPTLHYLFFSIIEIATTTAIVWFAWKWNYADNKSNDLI